MFYNIVYCKELSYHECIDCLNEEELLRFIEAYNTGDHEYFCQGETRLIAGIKKVNLYDTSKCPATAPREEIVARMNKFANSGESIYIVARPSVYPSFGKEVTGEYIKGSFGFKGEARKKEGRARSDEKKNEVVEEIPSGRIFCSHSTIDHEVVNKFCTLILSNGLGIKLAAEVFNTSLEGAMPASGEDFRARIKDELINARIVLQFISQNYKKSEVCLNEMGAAWVLSHRIVPLILENYDVGFINSTTQQVKLNNQQRIIAFVQDNKKYLCPKEEVNLALLTRSANEFVDWLSEYEKKKHNTVEEVAAPEVKITVKEKPRASLGQQFYKIDDHVRLYYYMNGEMREIPDDPTLYFLGFIPQRGATLIKSTNEIAQRVGVPMTSILSCPVRVDPSTPHPRDYWLLRDGKRHGLDHSTLTRIRAIKGQKYTPPVTIATEELLKIPQGNKVDLSKMPPKKGPWGR